GLVEFSDGQAGHDDLRNRYAINDGKFAPSLQSQLPDGDQNSDEGRRDDPERRGAPAALAALGPADGRNRLGRQGQALPGHLLHVFEHGNRPRGDGRQASHHAAEFARAGHRALNPPERTEIALDPFAHHGIGDFPDIEFGIEPPRYPFDHYHGLLQQDQLGPG